MNGRIKVNAGSIFSKTIKFCLIKLMLGVGTLLISGILLAVLLGIGLLIGGDVAVVMFFVWLVITGLINFFINRYIGYLVKAGHIAIITEAAVTGIIPDNQLEYAVARVKNKFTTANIYFGIDSLVSGAVKQLQHAVQRIGNLLGAVPGMDIIASLIKLFIDISLGYVDECCLGYTFYKEDQNAFKSAADGVVIYYQNWKKLLKNAITITLTVVITFAASAVILFFLFYALFNLIIPEYALVLAALFAGFLSYVIKYSFIDSWILVKTMVTYMALAPSTEITYDLYGKLCGLSKKFKDLFQKGIHTGDPVAAYETPGAYAQQQYTKPAQQPKPVFCGECGTKNRAGSKFCDNCGSKIG